jgi:hypothetical protein
MRAATPPAFSTETTDRTMDPAMATPKSSMSVATTPQRPLSVV